MDQDITVAAAAGEQQSLDLTQSVKPLLSEGDKVEGATVAPPQAGETPRTTFTQNEWKAWKGDLITRWGWQNISQPEILQILGVERPSQYQGTLEEAGKLVNEAITARLVTKLNTRARAILNQKQVPAMAWPDIYAEAGDPALFLDEADQTTWLDRIAARARDYLIASVETPALPATIDYNKDKSKQLLLTAVLSPVATLLKLPTPDEFKMLNVLTDFAAQSGFFPGVDTPAKAMMICWKALEWGISATEALQNIYIIERKNKDGAVVGQTLYPGTSILLGKVFASGRCHRFDLPPGDGKTATAIVQRTDENGPTTFTYTREEAESAGLTSNPAWKKDGKTMLQWRVARRAIKAKFSDVYHGFNSALADDED